MAELLCALAIISALSLCALLPVARSEADIVTEEAESLHDWLFEKMLEASHEGSSYKIDITESKKNRIELVLRHTDGPRYLETEKWRAENTWVRAVGTTKEMAFNGVWHTMSPAVTFMIRPDIGVSKILYVIISGAGRIRISDKR